MTSLDHAVDLCFSPWLQKEPKWQTVLNFSMSKVEQDESTFPLYQCVKIFRYKRNRSSYSRKEVSRDSKKNPPFSAFENETRIIDISTVLAWKGVNSMALLKNCEMTRLIFQKQFFSFILKIPCRGKTRNTAFHSQLPGKMSRSPSTLVKPEHPNPRKLKTYSHHYHSTKAAP